jgi:hypothetical protein
VQCVKRNKRRVYVCLVRDRYGKGSLHDPSFECDIRIRRVSFLKLVNLLRDDIAVHREMASIRGGEVSPELCVYLSICYLSGGHYGDNIRFIGISPAARDSTPTTIFLRCPIFQLHLYLYHQHYYMRSEFHCNEKYSEEYHDLLRYNL